MLSFKRLQRTCAIFCNTCGNKCTRNFIPSPIFSFGKHIHHHSFQSRYLLLSELRNSHLTRISNIPERNFAINHFSLSRSISKNSNAVDDRTQKALENEEFRDLLKDFAKDFGVAEDSLKILEDIKKEQEEPPVKDEAPIEKDCIEKSGVEATVEAYRSLMKDRFKVFEDKDATIIYSYEEEAKLELDDSFFHIDGDSESDTVKVIPKRGITGVYDIHEIVAILREENMMDIVVINIPKSYHYADYMVLANAKSPKHARAVSEFVVQFYKKKKDKRDPFVKIEGEKYGSWSAIDMGNIVLHIFLEDARTCYDIESLWLLDSEYDSGGELQHDEFTEIMQEELEFLNALQSSEVSDSNTELTK